MKSMTLKLDNFLLEILTTEAKQRGVTRMELIRTAIVNFLLHKEDAEDLRYIREHKNDKLVSVDEAFS